MVREKVQNKLLLRYQIVLLVISPCLALACGVLGNKIVNNQQLNQCPPIPTPMPSNLRPDFQGQIAFSVSCGYPGNTGDIFMMNADGTGVINLTDRPGDDLMFSWSPDGHYMAFTSDKNGKYDIYLLNKDSNATTRLTDNIGDDRAPLWSPNGQLIAFRSSRDSTTTEERGEIYVMKPDGSQQTRVSDINVRLDSSTRWAPDSLKLATEINGEIYILYLDGSASQNVTNNSADDF